jgi:hypothetical protein
VRSWVQTPVPQKKKKKIITATHHDNREIEDSVNYLGLITEIMI